MKGKAPGVRDTWRCPHGCGWLELPGREARNRHLAEHKRTDDGAKVSRRDDETVKRASLWDGVLDTYQTEGELNGWRPKQGALL